MAINDAAKDWGLKCLRYEISKFFSFCFVKYSTPMLLAWVLQAYIIFLEDISPPRGVKAAMEMQAEAERKKRALVLESEGNCFLLLFFN